MKTRIPSAAGRLKVMLLDEHEERSAILRTALADAGHDVVARVPFRDADLVRDVESFAPDLIIIDTASPDRDTLEHLCVISATRPRPIVMFSGNRDSETIREAIRAGVSAYVVDGLAVERVQPLIDAAIARFEQFQALREELAETQSRLDERKRVDRAKGLLMDRKRISEQDAYALMRRMAMDRNVRLAQVADEIIRMSAVL